jgi:hypothetical protein
VLCVSVNEEIVYFETIDQSGQYCYQRPCETPF